MEDTDKILYAVSQAITAAKQWTKAQVDDPLFNEI